MSQLVGTWVAGDSGKSLQYFVSQGGAALDVSAATNVVLSLTRMVSGSDLSVVISGAIISPGTLGGFEWVGAQSVGANVPQPSSRKDTHIYEARVSFTIAGKSYWTEPFRVAVNRWNLSTAPTGPPTLNPNGGLQEIADELEATGGSMNLGIGTYYGDPASPSTPLVIRGPIRLSGVGYATKLGSPVLFESAQAGIRDLHVKPVGTAYGIRIFKTGLFTPRCFLKRVFVGATSAGSGDGPIDGIQLDGAGVLSGDQVTAAFCTGHGLLVDSTSTEPNTTLRFGVSSFVQNGLYGVKVMQSCTLAEFNGGNMEDNGSGEFYAESAAGIRLLGVDFERGGASPPSIQNVVEIENCNTITIEGCNFYKISAATRAFLIAGCFGGVYEENRFQGWGAVGVARVAETSVNIRRGVNHIFDGNGWIEDYSR